MGQDRAKYRSQVPLVDLVVGLFHGQRAAEYSRPRDEYIADYSFVKQANPSSNGARESDQREPVPRRPD